MQNSGTDEKRRCIMRKCGDLKMQRECTAGSHAWVCCMTGKGRMEMEEHANK